MHSSLVIGPCALVVVLSAGCASPYRADQGALIGGLGGAGVGALVGSAVHHPLAGAAVGGLVGTLGGAAVGGSLDEIEARNRAEIEARLGRPIPVGAATVPDVIAMTHAGVSEEVIVTHVRNRGVAQILTAQDLIYLQQQGVTPRVIQAMQSPPPVAVGAVAPAPPPPVIVQQPVVYDPWYYGPPPPPRWYGPPYRYRHYRGRPRVGFGVSIVD